ncbi:ABC transporter ATP-binding protein [Methylocella sp. CPCC 101449]|uniref:ABC transporter ATP-binding protein n=1 Tax=Methylocella sp. CPCC 101449 TaxID=2987531 RepID=UPI00288D0D64|nr:ABC transporter ATP-binding protein [Methylocella sp. CPCC 101449]MDT2022404.1 ABC transporter ATP-binding protein [Methylocella sp. CPCC 101449]
MAGVQVADHHIEPAPRRFLDGMTGASAATKTIVPTTSPSDAYISIQGLSKTFAGRNGTVQALTDINLDIADGEFVSVIGPSGCGKSTLLMLLAGLEPKTGGSLAIGGRPVTTPDPELGVVFQQDVLLEWRSALENIVLQAEIRGLDKKAATQRAKELLAMVDLARFADAYPYELSGGMRQRVSICRALLHEPRLLLMDEPFGALDALTRDQLQIDLLRLWSRRKMTVLFITHSISEAVFLSDRIVVMSPRPGRIEKIITVDLPRPRRLAMRESEAFLKFNHEVTDVFRSLGVLRDDPEEAM